jgi:hypothetical protein
MTRAGSAVAGIPTLSDREDVPPLKTFRGFLPGRASIQCSPDVATNARSVRCVHAALSSAIQAPTRSAGLRGGRGLWWWS